MHGRLFDFLMAINTMSPVGTTREEHRMAKQLRRPTKEMMLAVNASIDGKKKEVDALVAENKLDRSELEQRGKLREGQPYSFTRKKRAKKAGKKAVKPAATPVDVLSMIDGRTKIVTLLEIEARVNELLSKKPDEDVTRVRDAIGRAQTLRTQLKEAESVLGRL